MVGLHGPWGSGKSSTVGLVRYYLDELPEEDRPVIVEFNPWWYSSSDEDIARRFFYQLRAQFSKWTEFSRKLGNAVADYGDLIGELPVPGADVGGKALKKLRSGKKDVVDLKRDIEKLLTKQGRLILVVIDDVDRLQASEIRSLFRVVKAIADFPNIAYLVVFDQDVIVRSLEDAQQGLPGEAYLEKIVQVPFALPLPDRPTLRRLLFSRLDTVMNDTPQEDFDTKRWANVYHKGLDWLIDSPRAAIRLTNSLSVTYTAVKGEVNPIDFIALEALRVFRPKLYELVRSNPDRFTSASEIGRVSDFEHRELETFHGAWIAEIAEKEREHVKELFSELFPRLDSVWRNRFWGSSEWSKDWRRNRRVAHPDCFPTYFRLAVPAGAISSMETKYIIQLTSDPTALRTRLLHLAEQKGPDGRSRARALLDRLTDFVDGQLTSDQAKSLVWTLLDVSDRLMIPDDVQPGMFELDNRFRIGWVVRPLFKTMTEADRVELLGNVIEKGESIFVPGDLVHSYGREHGRYGANEKDPEKERFCSENVLPALEDKIRQRLEKAAEDNTLLRVPSWVWLVYIWRTYWAPDPEVPNQWLKDQLESDDGLLSFLESLLQRGYRQSVTDVVGDVKYTINMNEVAEFSDIDALCERVRTMDVDGISDAQRTAVDAFLSAKANSGPDDPDEDEE